MRHLLVSAEQLELDSVRSSGMSRLDKAEGEFQSTVVIDARFSNYEAR
jgi:hypothetical protein